MELAQPTDQIGISAVITAILQDSVHLPYTVDGPPLTLKKKPLKTQKLEGENLNKNFQNEAFCMCEVVLP